MWNLADIFTTQSVSAGSSDPQQVRPETDIAETKSFDLLLSEFTSEARLRSTLSVLHPTDVEHETSEGDPLHVGEHEGVAQRVSLDTDETPEVILLVEPLKQGPGTDEAKTEVKVATPQREDHSQNASNFQRPLVPSAGRQELFQIVAKSEHEIQYGDDTLPLSESLDQRAPTTVAATDGPPRDIQTIKNHQSGSDMNPTRSFLSGSEPVVSASKQRTMPENHSKEIGPRKLRVPQTDSGKSSRIVDKSPVDGQEIVPNLRAKNIGPSKPLDVTVPIPVPVPVPVKATPNSLDHDSALRKPLLLGLETSSQQNFPKHFERRPISPNTISRSDQGVLLNHRETTVFSFEGPEKGLAPLKGLAVVPQTADDKVEHKWRAPDRSLSNRKLETPTSITDAGVPEKQERGLRVTRLTSQNSEIVAEAIPRKEKMSKSVEPIRLPSAPTTNSSAVPNQDLASKEIHGNRAISSPHKLENYQAEPGQVVNSTGGNSNRNLEVAQGRPLHHNRVTDGNHEYIETELPQVRGTLDRRSNGQFLVEKPVHIQQRQLITPQVGAQELHNTEHKRPNAPFSEVNYQNAKRRIIDQVTNTDVRHQKDFQVLTPIFSQAPKYEHEGKLRVASSFDVQGLALSASLTTENRQNNHHNGIGEDGVSVTHTSNKVVTNIGPPEVLPVKTATAISRSNPVQNYVDHSESFASTTSPKSTPLSDPLQPFFQKIQELPGTPIRTLEQISSPIIGSLKSQKSGQVEVQLRPIELGVVRLQFSGTDTTVNVMIAAERPEINDLVRRNISILTQDLKSMGYERIQVDVQSGNDGSTWHKDSEHPRLLETGKEEDEVTLEFEDQEVPVKEKAKFLKQSTSQLSIDIRL